MKKKNNNSMKKIKNFKNYTNENILYPRGGNIGGEHKKPITDEEIENGKAFKKGYKKPESGLTSRAIEISEEKIKNRKISLMGGDLDDNDMSFIKNIIGYTEEYLHEKNKKTSYYYDNIKSYIEALPKNTINHFNIDLNSDNMVEDFIENKYDLFKNSYEMFKELNKKKDSRYYN